VKKSLLLLLTALTALSLPTVCPNGATLDDSKTENHTATTGETMTIPIYAIILNAPPKILSFGINMTTGMAWCIVEDPNTFSDIASVRIIEDGVDLQTEVTELDLGSGLFQAKIDTSRPHEYLFKASDEAETAEDTYQFDPEEEAAKAADPENPADNPKEDPTDDPDKSTGDPENPGSTENPPGGGSGGSVGTGGAEGPKITPPPSTFTRFLLTDQQRRALAIAMVAIVILTTLIMTTTVLPGTKQRPRRRKKAKRKTKKKRAKTKSKARKKTPKKRRKRR